MVKCHFYYVIFIVYTINMIMTVDVDHLAEPMFVRFLHCKITSVHLLSTTL